MPLDKTATTSEIVSAMNALPPTATAAQRWDAMIGVLYTRIKADILIESIVAAGIPTPAGPTTGPGTATSSEVS